MDQNDEIQMHYKTKIFESHSSTKELCDWVLTSIFEKQGEKLTKANIIRTTTLHNTEGENESDKDGFEFPERWRYNREVIRVSFMHFPEFSCAGEEGEDEEDGGG